MLVEPRSPMEHVFSRIRIPRLGTILLGTILRDLGYEVRVLVEEISGTTIPSDLAWADAVCLSSTTSTAPRAYHLADLAREMGKTVVMGGPHVTFLPEEALNHGDMVVCGEGEKTVVELFNALNSQRALDDIRGLSYTEGGRPRHNPPRPLISDLDTLPIPDFSLVRGWNPRRAVVPVATSRGCPYFCKFCSVVPMFGRGYRTRSIDLIMEELRANARQTKHLFFCDDNFFANPRRAKELLRRMKEDGIPREWSAQVRAEAAFDTEFLELLRETNCFTVYIGFESANPQVLKAYRKKQSVDDMRRAIEAFHRYGIHIHGMFILGADEDTPATIRDTARFAVENHLDSVQFLMLTPLPGTESFLELEAADRLLTREWNLYDGSHAVFQPRSLTADELQEECYRSYLTFYSRRAILTRLVKLDLFYGYIRFYARRLVKKAKAGMRDYRRWLAGDFLSQAQRRYGLAWKRRGVRKVALLSGNASEAYRNFLANFLSRLGVEVLQGADTPEFFRHLKEKTELVIVPLLNYAQEKEKFVYPAWEQLLATLKEKLPEGLSSVELVIDLKKESLYCSCLQFGLLFSSNMKKIRRAYRGAFRSLGPLPDMDLRSP